jgi:hypothetical protein
VESISVKDLEVYGAQQGPLSPRQPEFPRRWRRCRHLEKW